MYLLYIITFCNQIWELNGRCEASQEIKQETIEDGRAGLQIKIKNFNAKVNQNVNYTVYTT